jgi:uncharacterized membrane protein YozB (DUF420 family)
MLIAVSTLILIIIGVGWLFRRNARRHIPCMALAFLLDLGLLLYIEGTRHAINTVATGLKTPESHGLLLFHVTMSLLVLLLYLAQITSGVLLYRGRPGFSPVSVRNFHRFSAMAFLLFRGANYVTSFFVGKSR